MRLLIFVSLLVAVGCDRPTAPPAPSAVATVVVDAATQPQTESADVGSAAPATPDLGTNDESDAHAAIYDVLRNAEELPEDTAISIHIEGSCRSCGTVSGVARRSGELSLWATSPGGGSASKKSKVDPESLRQLLTQFAELRFFDLDPQQVSERCPQHKHKDLTKVSLSFAGRYQSLSFGTCPSSFAGLKDLKATLRSSFDLQSVGVEARDAATKAAGAETGDAAPMLLE